MKLTNWIRDAIVANAVEKAGINKAYADYREERQQWACAVADESIGGADAAALLEEANKKITRIVKSLPESLQSELRAGPLEGTIFASFGGMRTRINEWPGHRPARTGMILASDHPLTIQFEKLEAREKELASKKSNLRAEVRAVVGSVTTVNKLLAVWPDAKELIPAQAVQSTNLPAVNIESLNAAIGLPSE